MFKVICAWCGKHLKGSESDVEVSHGICEQCQTKTLTEEPLLVAAQPAAGTQTSGGLSPS